MTELNKSVRDVRRFFQENLSQTVQHAKATQDDIDEANVVQAKFEIECLENIAKLNKLRDILQPTRGAAADADDDDQPSVGKTISEVLKYIDKQQAERENRQQREHADLTERITAQLAQALREPPAAPDAPAGPPPPRRSKLPDIKLPQFSGNFEDWLEFKNSFESMVHNNQVSSNSIIFGFL